MVDLAISVDAGPIECERCVWSDAPPSAPAPVLLHAFKNLTPRSIGLASWDSYTIRAALTASRWGITSTKDWKATSSISVRLEFALPVALTMALRD